MLVLAPAVLAGLLAGGNVYSYAPDGSADFDDLQVALDAVPEGATILVEGHAAPSDPLVVTRSVALLGGIPGLSEWPRIFPTLVVDAPGADVVLERLYLGGDYGAWTGDALELRAARSVTVRNCSVLGGSHDEGPVEVYDAGLHVTGPVALVALDGVHVQGFGQGNSGGVHRIDEGGPWVEPPTGGPALVLPESFVGLAGLSGCSVVGGMGAWIDYRCDPALDLDPPGPLVGGSGGPALVGTCHASGTSFVGGSGGGLMGDDDGDGCVDDVACAGEACGGVGESGPDVVGTVVPRELGAVQVVAPVGGTGSLRGRVQGPGMLVVFFVAADLAAPIPLRRLDGPLQVLPPWLSFTTTSDGHGYAAVTADLPDDPTLAGVPIFAQALSGAALSMVGVALLADEG